MSGELVFTVNESVATPATRLSLAEAGLHERAHLQEWVIAHPQILGPDVLIVSFEEGQWVSASGSREADRLDVLGLDSSGQLVVAELKRGRAPDTIDMQAVKYAAMASRFTVELLVSRYARFLKRSKTEPLDAEDVEGLLMNHAPDLNDETLRTPRIVLVATEFAPVVSATAVFLSEVGLDIRLVQFQAYRTPGNEILVTVSRLFPPPEVDELVIEPKALQQRKAAQERTRERNTVSRLVEYGALEDGTQLRLEPPVEEGPNVDAIRAWISEDPRRGRTTWRNHRGKPLRWEVDGLHYSPTRLAIDIWENATDYRPGSLPGPLWWQDSRGRHLRQIADEFAEGAPGS